MKTETKFILVVAAFGAAIAGYAFTRTSAYGELCESLGGKWASVSSTCVTRSCYQNGDCGYWANPAARCSRLKVGDPLLEVYFQLGQPDRIEGKQYIWHKRKGSAVTAEIENGTLKILTCNITTASRQRRVIDATAPEADRYVTKTQ